MSQRRLSEMKSKSPFISVIPVLPSQDIDRDVEWYIEKTGFEWKFGDHMYCGLQRDHLAFHLQWHADTEEDPLLGGSVIRFHVHDAQSLFKEFLERGTVKPEKLRLNTPWKTHEFGFYDLNNNALFFFEDV